MVLPVGIRSRRRLKHLNAIAANSPAESWNAQHYSFDTEVKDLTF